MLNLEVKTRLQEEEALRRLKSFFKEGYGLNVTHEAPDHLAMEGGGGYVAATVCRDNGETRIELETREWEQQVKKFAEEVT